MQFLIIGRDGTDAEAPARRQATRPAHIKGLNVRNAAGKIVKVGALLDEAGNPVGSAMTGEFADRAGADAHVASEPYTKTEVWATTEVTPLRPLSFD
ncbi:YciI family protein [Brevundimonas sp. SL161]|uniref:YciI family protein n=1 Tax=Brevundimonas sp. SL161 TaxID=2804613 RepID=UPI003CF29293